MWTVLPRGSFISDRDTGRDTEVVAMKVEEAEVRRETVVTPVSFLTRDLHVVKAVAPHHLRLTLGKESD